MHLIFVIYCALVLVASNPFFGTATSRKLSVEILGNTSSLFEVEHALALKEQSRMNIIFKNLQALNYEIRGFYHTSTWKDYWAQVITEQLLLLDGKRKFPKKSTDISDDHYAAYDWDHSKTYTSLLNITTELYLNVAISGDEKNSFEKIKSLVNQLGLRDRKKIVLNYNRTIGRYDYQRSKPDQKANYDRDPEISVGEYTTIMKLKSYCEDMTANNKKAMVYYIHSKGSCCMKESQNFTKPVPVAAWREYMNAMNIEFPSICIRALLNKYSACGVENQDAHFSGNFWWADCAHVAKLPVLENRFDFMGPELFILRGHKDSQTAKRFGFHCGYSIHNCGVNLYLDECPRKVYRDRIVKYVYFKNGPNNVDPHATDVAYCRDLASNSKNNLSYLSLGDSIRQRFG